MSSAVDRLHQSTGQRIRLVTRSGAVLADSDQMAGREARSVASPAILVDPRPLLSLPPELTTQPPSSPGPALAGKQSRSEAAAEAATVNAIATYRSGIL